RVAEEGRVTGELLCEVCTQEGFEAEYVQSGESALAAVAVRCPDAIVSDIRMKSRLDGLGVLERMQREHPATPVVLITAFGSIDSAIRAVKEGAFDYISKPFDIGALVAPVRRGLARTRAAPPRLAAT